MDIDTQPAMPVMADGFALGEGPVRITVQRHALAVMVGESAPEAAPDPGEILRHKRMRPPDEMRLPGDQHLGAWGRLTLWVSLNRPIVWLVGLTAGLVLFLACCLPTCGCSFGTACRPSPSWQA